MSEQKTEGRIFLTTVHHSDLTWQFPYEEYNAIRERQLNLVMDFFAKYEEYGFVLDQAYVLQNYLERNPEKKEQVKRLLDGGKGSLELTGGYTIPDLNLCSGESFLRNCMLGQRYYMEELGYRPHIASLMDAFGLPFQVPQMLALLGYRYLAPGRMPNAPRQIDPDKPFVWKGMAGTSVTVVPHSTGVDKSSYLTNVPMMYDEDERFEKTLRDLQDTEGNVLAYYMTEIQMLDEAFFRHLDAANRRPDAKRKVTFGRLADFCKTLQESKLPECEGEFNPVFTGCYTTRIGVKQKIRAAESALFGAELACALTGREPGLAEAWRQLSLAQFHDGACGCHHDACNTDVMEKLDYVQRSAEELLDKALGAGEGAAFTVLNPSACGDVQLIETVAEAVPADTVVQRDGGRYYFAARLPVYGAAVFAQAEGEFPGLQGHLANAETAGREPGLREGDANRAAEPVKHDTEGYAGETEFFAFDFSGIMPVIRSKRYGSSVFGQERFGEILFRHESGSMWDEMIREAPCGAEYQEEQVVRVEEGPLFVKVTVRGSVKPGRKPISGNLGDYWPGFEALSFTKEYLFPQNLPYFRLRLTIDFSGRNTKISLRIPVELDPLKAKAFYDTPFGAMQRKPYFEVPCKYGETMTKLRQGDYAHAKGDYPALQWVDYQDEAMGIAVANNGTPGHQLVGKDIFISLLRSGTDCKDGTMYPQPGAYDNGTHVYDFAFTDHAPGETEAAVALGELLNRAPVCVPKTGNLVKEEGIVRFCQPNIVVSAVYPGEQGIVVRAFESLGRETVCELQCGKERICYSADVYGRPGEVQDMQKIRFLPFEIRTFVLKED